ncbi:unnamed protein product [Prunus armeniaca]
MELNEIEELPKRLIQEEAGHAFCLQASVSFQPFPGRLTDCFLYISSDIPFVPHASMDMWLCVKRAINAAKKAKKAYEDGRARVAEAGKAIQDHANLAKDLQAAER